MKNITVQFLNGEGMAYSHVSGENYRFENDCFEIKDDKVINIFPLHTIKFITIVEVKK